MILLLLFIIIAALIGREFFAYNVRFIDDNSGIISENKYFYLIKLIF